MVRSAILRLCASFGLRVERQCWYIYGFIDLVTFSQGDEVGANREYSQRDALQPWKHSSGRWASCHCKE